VSLPYPRGLVKEPAFENEMADEGQTIEIHDKVCRAAEQASLALHSVGGLTVIPNGEE
jgi:hypothetical protein